MADDHPGAHDPAPTGVELPEGAEPHLDALGARFLLALEAMRRGDVDRAADELRSILRAEPRLAEPRMELARLLLQTDQPEEAAEQAEEALSVLDSGGQWLEDLPENVVRSVAWNLRGEALRQQADRDEVVFGDPERWKALVEEARQAFARAATLDPENRHAHYWAGGTDSDLLVSPTAADGEEGDGDDDDTDILRFSFGGPEDPVES